jgi:radical SAM superfamily enzyme
VQEMIDEIDIISGLPVNSIKFHQLQLLKNTKITEEYILNPSDFHIFDVPEYIDFITEIIEKLRPDIVVERIAGEVPPKFLAVSAWCSLRNDQLLALFEKNLETKNTWQGRKYIFDFRF